MGVPHEALSVPCSGRIDLRGREVEIVIGDRQVFGRASDLDDFEIGGAFENSVSDVRGLGDAFTGPKHEGIPLTFVGESDPSSLTEDQLEENVVMMRIVGYRTGGANTNVRSDDRSALSIGNDVAIFHASPADVPGLVSCSHLKSGCQRRARIHRWKNRDVWSC